MESNEKIIALTRPQNRTDEAVKIIESYGAKAILVPTLDLELVNSASLKNLMKRVNELDWLIFTSVTSIEAVFKFYPDFREKLNINCKLGVIGHKTAELCEKYGLNVDLIPENYTAEGLIESFTKIDLNGKVIGVPRTFKARTILPEELKKMGAEVLLAESYQSIIPKDTKKIEDLIEKILESEIDGITFTSPLTVENLFKLTEDKEKLSKALSENLLTVSIGPITGKILDKYKVKHIYPERYTVKDMLNLMFDSFN